MLKLTTCRQFVSAVLTVGNAVAKSALVDTFGGALRTALGTMLYNFFFFVSGSPVK
jgi:hypothetical protein